LRRQVIKLACHSGARLPLQTPLAGIAEHIEDPPVQIPHRPFEVEIGQDYRPDHASVEMCRYELRQTAGINGLEQPLLHSVTNNLGKKPALLDVESFNRLSDSRIAVMGAAEIKCNFYKTVYFIELVDMIGKPRRDDRGRIGGTALQCTHVLEGARHGA